MPKLKLREIGVLSVLVVLISSWFIGNLMDLTLSEGIQDPFISELRGYVFLFASGLLIMVALGYLFFLWFVYGKKKGSLLVLFLLLGFWIFAFLGAVFLVFYTIPKLGSTIGLEIYLPEGGPYFSYLIDIGFVLIITLSGLLFLSLVYTSLLKERREKKGTGIDHFKTKELAEEEESEEEIERSISSTLDKAILELDEGLDVRTTIIRCYKEMSDILEKSGVKNAEFMTPREFKDETVTKISAPEKLISKITFLFEEARYSPHQLGEDEREKALQYLKDLKERLR
ncbi:MAG: DUF4129 domain-containing protein [Candidatus Thermoplasmatota archaeon]|nr:DUF4129 domain-containing protein [Candidatus Thermoplasmatota archaeon]